MKSTLKKCPDGKYRVDGNKEKSRLETPIYNFLVNYSFALKFADGNKN